MNFSVKNPERDEAWLKHGLFALAGLVYFLIIVGGLVRNLGAGLSCPDWPLCKGKIVPDMDILVFAEYFHRVVAGTVSILTLGGSLFIYFYAPLRKLLSRQATLAILLLASQVVLGGLTVLKLLQSEIVTLHLVTGTLFFAVILIMNLRLYRLGTHPDAKAIEDDKKRREPTSTWRFAIAALVALFLQIILGGVVSSHYAGLACPDFPTCLGVWWPGFDGIAGIHFLHRVGAIISSTVIAIFIAKTWMDKSLPRHIQVKTRFILLCLVLQILLGIGNVIFHLPLTISVAHLAIAEVLFALILISTYEIRHFQLR